MERISNADIPAGMFDQLLATEHFINDSSLPMFLLEIIRLRVAQLNGCAYCVDQHHKELKHQGETDLRLSSLCVWPETPYYSDRERVVLEFTERLTQLGEASIPNELFERLREHFSKQEICFLTLAVAQINTWTRLMKTFRFTPRRFQVQGKAA